MPRWILAFAALGAVLAEVMARLPLGEAANAGEASAAHLLLFAALYPGFIPFAGHVGVKWWIDNPLLVHLFGAVSNAAFFGLLGAWLHHARESATLVRFGAPAALWILHIWFWLEGLFRLRRLMPI